MATVKIKGSKRLRERLLDMPKSVTMGAVRRAARAAAEQLLHGPDDDTLMRLRIGKRAMRAGAKPGTRAFQLALIEAAMVEAERALARVDHFRNTAAVALLQVGDALRAHHRLTSGKPKKKGKR